MISILRRTLVANVGLLAGLLLGTALGLFGLIVGLILGFMVDTIRAERGLRAYLCNPGAAIPDEALPGLIAALALASGIAGELPANERRSILTSLVDKALRGQGVQSKTRILGEGIALLKRLIHRPWLGSVVALLSEEAEIDVALLARRLSLEGSAETRYLLAEATWALEARRGSLEWVREGEIVSRLADSGLDRDKIHLARARYFPGWRSPWEVLGLAPGSPAEAVRRAYRSLSKRLHPDSSGHYGASADSESFRELKAAYEALSARRAEKPNLGL